MEACEIPAASRVLFPCSWQPLWGFLNTSDGEPKYQLALKVENKDLDSKVVFGG